MSLSLLYNGLNTVTNNEYAKIVASLESVYVDDFNCKTCLSKRTDPQRKSKGCFTYKRPKTYTSNKVKFSTCIGNYANPSLSMYLIEMYRQYDKGTGCDVNTTTSKKIELMRIVDSFIMEKKEIQAAANAKQVKKRR